MVTVCLRHGGHFILIYGYEDTNRSGQCDSGDRLKIYDPYLYSGKFNLSTRRGKATVSGNTVYVEKETFRNYANYSGFFAFKNDRTDKKENNTTVVTKPSVNSTVKSVNYKVRVTAKIGLNGRTGASTSYPVKRGYARNQQIQIVAESNGWGKTSDGVWVSLQYVSKITNITGVKNTVGQYKKFAKTYTYIYTNSNLTGAKYYYLKNTRVKILKNVSSKVDRIHVPATGRYGYVSTSVYK